MTRSLSPQTQRALRQRQVCPICPSWPFQWRPLWACRKRIFEKVAEESIPGIINGLTQAPASPTPASSQAPAKLKPAAALSFSGKDYTEAVENMEKYYLSNRWSDGLPLVPATKEAVEAMLKGTNLPGDHVVGIVDPKKGIATVEKIAINAVMAGAKPAYMPIDHRRGAGHDRSGIRPVRGPVHGRADRSPAHRQRSHHQGPEHQFLLQHRGAGLGANSTIGRAVRLILINLGQPAGINDMKDVGNPAKFTVLIGENELQTPKGWPTLREEEGFGKDVSTVSVYAALSFRQIGCSWNDGSIDTALDYIARNMATALNANAEQWGEEVLVVLSPANAGVLAKQGLTPDAMKKALFEKGRNLRKFFGPRPLGTVAVAQGVPQWIDDLPDNGLAPTVPEVKDIKVFIAGGNGSGCGWFIDRWGFGQSHLITKEITLPPNWKGLVSDLQGWETPVEVK